mmetsp:Transcript_68028/g.136869  ORF Transcript_68028/g.136869 Transcript_68028/m.136869 type:complete len:87 (-) Transcript_68028:1231-1491(-)
MYLNFHFLISRSSHLNRLKNWWIHVHPLFTPMKSPSRKDYTHLTATIAAYFWSCLVSFRYLLGELLATEQRNVDLSLNKIKILPKH